MACIKSISRSALVAFSPDAQFMATGTLAGAVDLSFSSSANLEIFKVDLQSSDQDLPLVASCPSNERFNRLSWGKRGPEDNSLGLLAGGLGDGSISVWNPKNLISSDDIDGACVARLEKHSGPVRGLEFSCISPNLLASGADEGEVCIWDLANPVEPNLFPSLKNPGSGAQGEISFVSWNPKVQHILASTSYNGTTVVWDLRKQKPLISISDSSKRRCSVLQWSPDISTQLVVASDDDSSPSLKLWDVRKTVSPINEFVGHTKGVIAMSWCPNDGSRLVTCAKDNRTICWDTTTGEALSELPASTNWNFDVHWYTKIPGIISASSYDGKIGLYNIEAYRGAARDGGFEFQVRSRAPNWLKCPVGVSFGFGGKLVSFQRSLSATGVPCVSGVYLHHVVTEDSLVKRSVEFEAAVHNGEKSALRLLCEKKSEDSVFEDDKEAWGFLKIMFEDEGTTRTKLLGHLGFMLPNARDGNASDELGNQLTSNLNLNDKTAEMMGMLRVEDNAFQIDNGEDFFNNIESSAENFTIDGDNPLIEAHVSEELQEPGENIDESILHALIIGDYKGAVQRCMSANRMADALIIANASGPANGPSLWENTRDQYLKQSHLPYLKVISALVNNDLMSIANTGLLNSWKETLALLCTFAQKEEWTVLCDSLASRLMVEGNTLAATLCYMCAGNIDKTVEIWSFKLNHDTAGKSYVDLLQDLMEKIITLALATGQKQFSASLSKLIENYAELLVSQGLLTTALGYLKLLGSEDSSQELATLRNRILLSVEDKEIPNTLPSVNVAPQAETFFGSQPSNEKSHLQQQGIPRSHYVETYHQQMNSYGAYQSVPEKKQFQDYVNSVPFQPAPSPQMFVPSQTPQMPQMSTAPPVTVPQPASTPFIPATPPTLRNVGQYQQPTLGSQLYPGSVMSSYQPGQHGHSSLGVGNFPQPVVPTQVPGVFPAVTNPGFVQNTGIGAVQPSSPTQTAYTQPINAPPAPPPTVQTADTTNVSAELRPVITTLTRLYNETSEALGGSNAAPSKRREIEDNSRKIGALFAKLNNQDISPNAASKLVQLCRELDVGDYSAASKTQVLLTTSEWDECNFWLSTLKRMMKTRQSVKPH